MTSIRIPHDDDRLVTRPARSGRVLERALLVSGVLSSLVYVASDLTAATRYPGYSIVDQMVSELSAVGAPTAEFWSRMMWLYGVLVAAFAVGVLRAAGRDRPLRVTGALLLAFVVTGVLWRFFPMHQRGAGMNWRDIGHIVAAVLTVLLMLAWTGVGAFALGRRFRVYSFVTLATLLAAGALTFAYAGRIGAGEPTPWMGIVERINIYGYLLWVAVLSVALARRSHSGDFR